MERLMELIFESLLIQKSDLVHVSAESDESLPIFFEKNQWSSFPAQR